VPFEDLVGEGCVGLLKAVRRFEPSTGTRFTTYASFWIRKQMLQALGDQTRVIHVPRYARQNGERAPREVRIDAEPAGTGGARLADRLADHALVSATDRLIGDQTLIKLRRQVRALPARERMVVARRFGLDGEAPVTLGDVGRHLGISRERVRQIERAALARLLKGIRRSSL
jgi:RNA polymerase sigma factor (sigma-70 family)